MIMPNDTYLHFRTMMQAVTSNYYTANAPWQPLSPMKMATVQGNRLSYGPLGDFVRLAFPPKVCQQEQIDAEAVEAGLAARGVKTVSTAVFRSGGSANFHVVRSHSGRFYGLRVPKPGSRPDEHLRAISPIVLQPYAKVPLNPGKAIELLPLGPIISNTGGGGAISSNSIADGLTEISVALRFSGLAVKRMTDFMPLPDGTLLSADPGNMPLKISQWEASQRIDMCRRPKNPYAEFMTWTDEGGRPKQQAFFPPLKPGQALA